MLPRFGLFPVRSPLLGESRLISIPPGTEMFQFPGLAPLARWPASPPVGFPHSGILGSRLMCSSPRLIAAYHALHRLSMPRHPPCALLRLISNLMSCLPCDRAGTTGVDSSHPACSHPATRKRAAVRQQANHPFVDCQRAGRIPPRKRDPGPAKKK
jgi:hypothetical protein